MRIVSCTSRPPLPVLASPSKHTTVAPAPRVAIAGHFSALRRDWRWPNVARCWGGSGVGVIVAPAVTGETYVVGVTL